MKKKSFGFWNQRQSSSGSSASQSKTFSGPGRQCRSAISLRSVRHLKSYTAFGKIHKAACRGDAAMIQYRLQFGKNGTDDRDRKNRTVLHYACAHGHPGVVVLLMEWKCDIDLRDSDNSTALIKASQYEHEECMAILLRHGADPNAADNRGNTALHYAVWSNNASMAKILLAHGANISIRNKDGFTPVILALKENNVNLADILVSQRPKIKKVNEPDSNPSDSDPCGSIYSSRKYEDKAAEKTEKHEVSAEQASEILNHSAAAVVPQREDRKAEEQQVPAEENREDNGPSETTSNEKNKAEGQGTRMSDHNNLIPPYERSSEDYGLLRTDTLLAQIGECWRQNKDCGALMIIWCGIHSQKRSFELKTHKYNLLTERYKNLTDNLDALQKELSETTKENPHLETEEDNPRAELCSPRPRHEDSDLVATTRYSEEETEQLQRAPSENIEEELKKQIELYHTLTHSVKEVRRRDSELKKEIIRYKNLCRMLKKDTDAHENGECTCGCSSSTNHCELDAIFSLRCKHKEISTKLQQAVLCRQRLEKEDEIIQKKLLETTEAQEKCEMLEENNRKLVEEIFHLETHIENHMTERCELEKYKQAIEEEHRRILIKRINDVNLFLQKQAALDKEKEKLRQDYITSMRVDMESRMGEMEAEMLQAESHRNSTKIQLEAYKQIYEDQVRRGEALKDELDRISRTPVRLLHTNSRIGIDNEVNGHSYIHTDYKSAPERPSDRNLWSRTEAHVGGLFQTHGLESELGWIAH